MESDGIWYKTKTEGKLFSGLYSFVENFGDNGNDFFQSRIWKSMDLYSLRNMDRIDKMLIDNYSSPTKHQRYDYGAGVEDNKFYMYTRGLKK